MTDFTKLSPEDLAAQLAERDAELAKVKDQAYRAGMRAAGAICRKRAEERFEKHGIREHDTNACYYPKSIEEDCEARDDEDEACAIAILAEANK